MELKQARFNMIEQQIRTWEVLDQSVLDLLERIVREDFVPEEYRRLAYADIAVPLGHEQLMMHPRVEARMLQALSPLPADSVLEIGTGSGYVTALLAAAARHVLSLDIFPDFKEQAEERLAVHGINNVTLEAGDALQGWDGERRFDVIAVTGSLPALPEAFTRALNQGGRLFAVVGEAPVMEALLIRRVARKQWRREVLFETELPALINARRPARFVF